MSVHILLMCDVKRVACVFPPCPCVSMCAMCLCDQNIALAIVILPHLVHILHTLWLAAYSLAAARV